MEKGEGRHRSAGDSWDYMYMKDTDRERDVQGETPVLVWKDSRSKGSMASKKAPDAFFQALKMYSGLFQSSDAILVSPSSPINGHVDLYWSIIKYSL